MTQYMKDQEFKRVKYIIIVTITINMTTVMGSKKGHSFSPLPLNITGIGPIRINPIDSVFGFSSFSFLDNPDLDIRYNIPKKISKSPITRITIAMNTVSGIIGLAELIFSRELLYLTSLTTESLVLLGQNRVFHHL